MAKIIAWLPFGAAVSRVVVGVWNVITPSVAPQNRDRRRYRRKPQPMERRYGVGARILRATLSLVFSILIASGLLPLQTQAQTTYIYVQPAFLYEFYNVQCCAYGVTSSTPPATWGTLSAAWAWSQAAINGTYEGSTATAIDLIVPTGTIVQDGYPTWYDFSVQVCGTDCVTHPNIGYIQSGYTCPQNSSAGDYDYTPPNQLIACAVPVFNVQPPPKICLTCLGDPIFAGTGQQLEVETDYSGTSGLKFTRTYLSSNGYFASALTQAFVDGSSPAGTVSQQCFPGPWTYSGTGGTACFPYISLYPYVNSGVAQYVLRTDDGRFINFSGPNSAITENADINDRVTQLTSGGVTEWQIKRDDDSTEIYNAGGALIQRTLRGGQSFTYTYSTSSTPASVAPSPGLLLTQSDAFGHTLSWQYNAAGQMSQMSDPTGGTYQYSYSPNGNLTGVMYPDGSSKAYLYNESVYTGGANLPTALTGITDESGVRYSTFQYQSGSISTFAVNAQHAGGVDSYSFTYDPGAYYGSAITSTVVTDPLGTQRTYQFQNNLSYNDDSAQTQPAASGTGTATKSETYDVNGNPASVTDYNGNVTKYIYDLTRNLETSRTEAYGTPQARTITTTWNATWRQPALITEPNRTTGFTYDSLGNALTKTITDTTVSPNVARVWTYTYDSYGRMLTAKGPRTDVNSTTTYAYYTCTTGAQCGEIQTITDAAGHVTTFNTYNAHGQPLTITDPNGIVTTLTYDARQRLTSRQIGTETTSYSYHPTGLLNTVTLPDGSTITSTYDGAHRLTDVTDGLGNHIHYTLDAMGNHTAENTYDPSNTLRRTHSRVINALNQLYQDINAAGTAAVTTTFGYDNDGNQTAIAAPLSRNTSDQYDALSRLTQITDPNSGVTQFSYDANDNLASVKDPRSLTTTYSHNGFGDVTQQVSPDTGTTTNTYDSGGNLKTATDARSAVATYSYDALNRVTQAAYTDQTINFTYDAGTNGIGRLTGASDANHSLAWTYDTHGRVTGKGQIVGSVTKSAGYAYTNDDMTSIVTPSGQTITYGYTNHQITSIAVNGTTLLSGVTYFPYGPASTWTWGNGTATTTRTYDQDGKITSINTASDVVNYGYDNAFRITSIADTGITTDSWTVGYDALDRITGATESIGSYGWTYDANGNWTAQTEANASAMTISSTSNQITGTTGSLTRTYAYDAAGNTLSYSNLAFSYNQRGRMSSATAGTTTSNYVYSALGQMIKKTVGSTTTLLMYDEAGHLLGEYSSTGALIQETVWMGDIPVGTLRPSGSTVSIYYVETDQINAVRKVTRPSDNGLMWHWNAYPFGLGSPNENPSGLGGFIYNLRFPGQYFQAETGLYYNNFRDYDYNTGKYIESDPIGLQAGVNTYAYVGSNPLSYLDPFGLDETHVVNTSGGRSVYDGPTNGNWGGKCWSGGQYSCGGHPMGSKPPTDSADKCYMHHDNCYDKCKGNKKCLKACDAALLKELMLLSDDPTKWPEPPLKGTESDTMTYRNGAILIFRP